jgi:hypothetical protein
MEPWLIAVVVVVVMVVSGAVMLAVVSRKVFRSAAPDGVAAGFRLFPGAALMSGLAAGWEQDRAAMAGVLREDLATLRGRLAHGTARAGADADLRAAEQATERFAANENWADNLRAATAAMARANAGSNGDRPPCLFNPVHGPSAAEVEWAPGGGARRRVPVCADDAARLRDGGAPLVRTVPTEEGVVPYFSAHGRYVDWVLGWYDGFDPYLTARLLAGTPIGSHLPGRIRAIHGTSSDPLGEFGRIHD